MKLALLIHGHLRSYEKVYPSFKKNILDFLKKHYEVDIFMHTWHLEEFKTKTWHNGYKGKDKHVDYKKVLELYNPKRLIIEKQNIENPKKTLFNGTPVESFRCMWYSVYQACQLKIDHEIATGTRYNVVMKVRPDVQYFNPPLLEELKQTDKLWMCQTFSKQAAIDVINFSSDENMNKLCSVYANFEKYFNSNFVQSRGFERNESVFLQFLNDVNAPLEKSKYCMPRDWRLFRTHWELDHEEGVKKWDPALASYEIATDEKYKYFRLGEST